MIAVIAGTNRAGSNALHIAKYYTEALQQMGWPTTLIDLQELPENFLNTDLYEHRSDAFRPTEELMKTADAYVFIVPEYNGSFPGVLKVFLDAFDPKKVFHVGKQVMLVGESTGKFGNVRGLEHLAGVLNYLQLTVHPYRAHLMRVQNDLDSQGELIGEGAKKEIGLQLASFAKVYGQQSPTPILP